MTNDTVPPERDLICNCWNNWEITFKSMWYKNKPTKFLTIHWTPIHTKTKTEAGNVYGRKLLDDNSRDSLFIEFHTEDPDPPPECPCRCPCDRCERCHVKSKQLPPDLYVMAVDSTLYRRMMDEVVDSRSMPCGLFFCGHHEDVRYPDIRIAMGIVGMVFVGLVLAVCALGGDWRMEKTRENFVVSL